MVRSTFWPGELTYTPIGGEKRASQRTKARCCHAKCAVSALLDCDWSGYHRDVHAPAGRQSCSAL